MKDIVRLILDGTVIRTRLDKKATNISALAAIGVRRDGQKVLLSIRTTGGESTSAWRQFLEDLDARSLKRPEFVIVDGGERLNEEFRRRIETQTVLPCAEIDPMLLWALLASGQVQMRSRNYTWVWIRSEIAPLRGVRVYRSRSCGWERLWMGCVSPS